MKIDSFESDIVSLAQALGISRSQAISEIKILFAYSNSLDPVELIKDPNVMLDPKKVEKYKKLFKDRLQGKPVAYILGYKEFYGLSFQVNQSVLIPRPDTELLVDLAIQKIKQHDLRTVLELGTGSGAIAVSVATHMPHIKITATDVSSVALEVATKNAKALCPNNLIKFQKSDWFSEVSGVFDLVLSNPPYIAEDDIHLQGEGVRYEPLSALTSGASGLDALSLIIKQSKHYLDKGGWVLVEHGHDQRDSCGKLLRTEGFTSLLAKSDLGGNPRVSGGRMMFEY